MEELEGHGALKIIARSYVEFLFWLCVGDNSIVNVFLHINY
jgi:hypothetical protein